MSSDSDDDQKSLQDRLRARLRRANIRCQGDDSAIESDTKQTTCLTNAQRVVNASLTASTPALSVVKRKKRPVRYASPERSSDSEEEHTIVRRKSRAMVISSESEDNSSTSSKVQPLKNSILHVAASSDGVTSDSMSGYSSEQSTDESIDDFLDKEAEEVSGTESGTPDEEGDGDEVSTSDSDWDDDWISDAEELSLENTSVKEAPKVKSQATSSGFASDSSDGTSEKCPICLLRFIDQNIGTPESCDHSFCSECLQQWSKNVNTCPVDRQEFTLIHVRRRVGGKIVSQIPVLRREFQEEEAVDDLTYCEICGQSDREDWMLLCDGCDLGFHMDCLDPPLDHVPVEDWFCSGCAQNNASNVTDEANIHMGVGENAPVLGISSNRTRLLPRTRQLERFRTEMRDNIERRRLEQPSTSSGIDSQQPRETEWKKRKVSKKRVVRRKKTKSRKTSKTKSKQSSGKKTSKRSIKRKTASKSKKSVGKKRKMKRVSSCRGKRKKLSSRQRSHLVRVVPPQSVKGRLAEQLGMRPLRQPWQTVPDVRSSNVTSGIGLDRIRAGIPTLHIFGQRDQLDYFSGSEEESVGGGGIATVQRPRSSLTVEQRIHNRKRLLASLSHPCLPRRPRVDEPVADGTIVDLVDSILQSQTKMLSKKTDVKINIDGSLDIQLKEPLLKPELSKQAPLKIGDTNDGVRILPDTTTGHIVHAPMYSGGGNRRGGSGMHPHSYSRGHTGGGGMRGRGAAGHSGGGGNFHSPGFRSSFNNPENSRAQYEQYLGNNVPSGHSSNRPRPLRFRLNVTRRPLRRNAILRRGILPVEDEGVDEEAEVEPQSVSKEGEENVEGQKEDEDVDIYSDIEADSHKGASEADDEPSFGALLPPPEPPAILMNLGDQNSDDEASDPELVIDDHVKGPAEDTEDKYDPAEPCDDDSEEEKVCVPQADEIPLPPGPGPLRSPQVTVVEYSDDSQSVEAVIEDGKSEEEHVSSTSISVEENFERENCDNLSKETCIEKQDSIAKVDTIADDSSEDDEDDDCPNFSIYSAASVSLARQVEEIELEQSNETGIKDSPGQKSTADGCNANVDSTDDSVNQTDDIVSTDGTEESDKKTIEEGLLLEVDIEKSEKKALEDSAKDKDELEDSKDKEESEERDESEDSGSDDAEDGKKGQEQVLEEIFGLDDDSLVTAPLTMPSAPVVPGLEGLETEIISDGEEAMLDGDMSDPDIIPEETRHRKRNQRISADEKDKSGDPVEFEDGEIVDEARERRERKEKERKDKQRSEGDENVDISKSKDTSDDDKRKKRRRERSPKDRAPLSSSENRTKERDKEKGKDKDNKDKDKDKKKTSENDKERGKGKDDISWKKPSKSTKDRNYRDGKEKSKDDKKDDDKESSRKERKRKEKRKDLERYDVRKVLSDKTLSRQNKDAFGRDLDIRRRSRTRSRSRSRTRSRSRARSARGRSRSRSRSFRRAARSRSRSRARSPARSRLRHRSLSRSRRSRSRSRIRSGNRSRSRHRSVPRSRDRHRKSRSKDRGRRRSREQRNGSANRQRNRSTTASRERRREAREREQLRPRSSWSRSWSRSWSPSLSGSPQYPASETLARSFSRSWSRDRVDHVSTTDMVGGKHKTHKNLTVIVTNNKEESRRKRKDGKRGNKRRGSPAPSKEVFASGDNILVSVNFKSDKSGAQASNTMVGEKSSKRKRDEGRSKRSKKDKGSKGSKNDAVALEGVKPPEKKRKAPPPEASQKPVAIIDLEQSPYREYTPSPKDLIVLSDSEEDGTQANDQELQQMKQLMLDESTAVDDEQPVSTGPKTPPEPQIKFSINTKSTIRSMNNPLMDEEEEEENEIEADNDCAGTEMEVLHKGPNTPPESPMGPATPGSSPTSPDAYDPFEPTKSRSASPDEGAGTSERPALDIDISEEPLENGTLGNEIEDEARPKMDLAEDVLLSPKKGEGENLSPGTTAPEADESEKTKQMSPSSSAEAAAVKTPSKIVAAAGGSTEVTSSTSSSTIRPGPQRSVVQSERMLATVIKGVSTLRPTPKPSTPAKIIPRQNGESSAQTDVVDMDLDSPYSPASSEGDDLFEPPPVYSSKPLPKTAPRPKPATAAGSKADKFDNLFGSSPLQRVKYTAAAASRLKASGKNAGRNQAKLNKIVKHIAKIRKDGVGGKADEDQIKILDEVPSSAVEMQVKDKFLKKLNRQERVVEEVKLALKPHYYKKHINKEDYKEILRRSVPKICHNRSGEINPIKIRTLVEAYVKKIRYLKKKATSASGQLKQKVVKKQGD